MNLNNESDKEKNEFLLEENNTNEYLNLSYLSFLMLEMITGRNMEYLSKIFINFSEGNYFNKEIEEKNFNFPEEVSFEFQNIFYYFFRKKITYQDLEDILNHGFFSYIYCQ